MLGLPCPVRHCIKTRECSHDHLCRSCKIGWESGEEEAAQSLLRQKYISIRKGENDVGQENEEKRTSEAFMPKTKPVSNKRIKLIKLMHAAILLLY